MVALIEQKTPNRAIALESPCTKDLAERSSLHEKAKELVIEGIYAQNAAREF